MFHRPLWRQMDLLFLLPTYQVCREAKVAYLTKRFRRYLWLAKSYLDHLHQVVDGHGLNTTWRTHLVRGSRRDALGSIRRPADRFALGHSKPSYHQRSWRPANWYHQYLSCALRTQTNPPQPTHSNPHATFDKLQLPSGSRGPWFDNKCSRVRHREPPAY